MAELVTRQEPQQEQSEEALLREIEQLDEAEVEAELVKMQGRNSKEVGTQSHG